MEYMSKWIEQLSNIDPKTQGRLLISLLIFVALIIIHKFIINILLSHIKDIQFRYKAQKASSYITALVVIFLIGLLWFEEFQSITTFLGLFSAGLAIALKDLVVNVAGWLFIIWRKPFEVGDRIEIAGHSGDVIDLRIFQFTLLEIGNWVDSDQSTGRIIHIPNGRAFNDALANYSKGFQYIWNEIPVLITFESNWKKAKTILQKIVNKDSEHLSKEAQRKVKEASKKFMIFYSNLTPTVYTNVKDSGILLTLRYLCEPRRRRGTSQAIWEDILTEFAKHDDIDLAYSTLRIYDNSSEGKPGAKSTGTK